MHRIIDTKLLYILNDTCNELLNSLQVHWIFNEFTEPAPDYQLREPTLIDAASSVCNISPNH